jgi:hypothetical protein
MVRIASLCQIAEVVSPCTRALVTVSITPFLVIYNLRDARSEVFSEVGITRFSSNELNLGSAESWRWRIRPGIREMSANCIMHNRSQWEPKKRTWIVVSCAVAMDSR